MATRGVVLRYLDSVRAKEGWESFLADELQFTNFNAPAASYPTTSIVLDGLWHSEP
jgi:hypothetical protein